MVVSQSARASEVGVAVLKDGGNAVDAAVATAFALAVTYPAAGNIGGGGFLVYRAADGSAQTYDFREKAPAAAEPSMWLDADGAYDARRHHSSHLAVGVPGSVAGLHMVWEDYGALPWERLLEPAIDLARDGFPVSHGLADSLAQSRKRWEPYSASLAAFTEDGASLVAGSLWRQPDLARTLQRIADHGPAGFYQGETARLIVQEMQRGGGAITAEDLKQYRAVRREPIRGTYRGYDIVSMPPPSSGGVALVEMLNILEAYDLNTFGFGSAAAMHRVAEAARIAYRDRARFLGDPDYNADMPLDRLLSKDYAMSQRAQIASEMAGVSVMDGVQEGFESPETTHFSVVGPEGDAVSLTTTLEYSYGSGIVVPGAGFLLNNEMGDFNAVPGLTDDRGLIGTEPNLTQPGKRMLSSMTPTIVAREGRLALVTGSPGGRTIINTVLQTILNTVDFGMNPQEAVDAPRLHHQWFPDRVFVERRGFSPDTLTILRSMGHQVRSVSRQGSAMVIGVDEETGRLLGGIDRRLPDAGAAGF